MSRLRVLIVDDEKLDLFIANKLLNMEYEATGFAEPEEALTWASSNDFDVAVIDYYLTPPWLADAVLEKLRAVKGNNFRAYVLTNYVDQAKQLDLIKNGFEGVLVKPITLEKFRDIVSSLS